MNKLSVLCGAFSALMLLSCNKGRKGMQMPSTIPYPVVEVPTRNIVGYDNYPASIEGIINSNVRAKISGYIDKVLVDEGQKVSKGQVLFTLRIESLSQDAKAAEANVKAAIVEVSRLVPLVEKNIVSDVQLQTAKARLAQAQGTYNSIKANVEYANVKSQIDGNVGAINVREGALVSPADPVPLTTVSATKDVYAFFSINEKEYMNFLSTARGKTKEEKIKNLPPVLLQLANGELYSEKGKIETVTGQVDKSTGTVSFRARFKNPNGILSNGNSGIIKIPKTYENAIVVPEVATFEQQGVSYVYRVKNDTAYATVVDIKDRINKVAIIKSGISKGDKVVVEGIVRLRNASPVKEKEVDFNTTINSIKPTF